MERPVRLPRLALVLTAVALATVVPSGSVQSSVSANPGAACARFAAPTGSDTNAGTKRRPFRTAQRLVASLRAGQTGCFRQGTYDAGTRELVVRFPRAGAPSRPITIRNYPGERATLEGIVYVPHGSDHVTIAHLRIEGTGAQNSIQIAAADVTLRDNDITNAWRGGSCLILGEDNEEGQALRPIVRHNRFHECGNLANGNKDHAIYAANVADGVILRNVFWNSAAYAIHLYPNAQRMLVTRNIIDGDAPSVRGGLLFGGDESYASRDNVAEHNVLAFARTSNIESSWSGTPGSGNVARSNCLWNGKDGNVNDTNGGFESVGNVVANPRFVDRQSRDYRLRSGGGCMGVVRIGGGRRIS
jgi:hypothetical protein